jgi:acyl-CoA synthetase (AMP-forming)/AMP-acid ligase II
MDELLELSGAELAASTFWGILVRRVQATPDAPFAVEAATGERLSYRQGLQRAEGLAAWLFEQGVRPGERVAWQLPTGLPALLIGLALARLGAVQIPLLSLYGEREVRSVLSRNQARFHVVPAQDARGLAVMARQIAASLDDPATVLELAAPLPQGDIVRLPPAPQRGDAVRWIYITSGTTSEPKGACHTDETLLIGGRNLGRAMGATAADVGSIAFPIAHIGGAMYLAMLLLSGASVVVLERFVPAEAIELLGRYGATLAGGSTAHYQAYLAEQRRRPGHTLIPSLRLLAGGGAPKPPELFHQVVAEIGCQLTHAYGMTECPLMASGSVTDSAEQLAHSEGAPVDDVELRIVRADGTRAAVGENGEVRIRGAGVFKGYTDPQLNATAFDEQGFFRTGDLGVLRVDGYLAITGRLKDVIIRKGENISAKEIEDLLFGHPKVAEVAVIGLPDAERGERVCAVIESAPGEPLSFEEMVAHLQAAGLMRQKIPEQLELIDRLPRNETLNKVLKYVLRERFS